MNFCKVIPSMAALKRKRNRTDEQPGTFTVKRLNNLNYTLPTFKYGCRNTINEDDIYETHPDHIASITGAQAKYLWKQEVENAVNRNRKPLLRNLLIKMNGKRYVAISIAFAILELIFKPLQTVFLGHLISYYSSDSKDDPFIYGIIIILMSIFTMAITQPCIMESFQIALKTRIICSTLIYDKILCLKTSALGQTTPGQVINLISNDIGIFEKFMATSHYIWIGPIQAIIILCLMYKEVGISSVFGVLLLVLFLPLFLYLKKLTFKVRTSMSIRRDERLRITNEIIQGIKVIKMYAWEKPFAKIIAKCRKLEINSFKVLFYIKGASLFYQLFTTIALYITITSSTLINNSIDAKSAFVVLSFVSTLSTSLTFLLPVALTLFGEVNVCLQRINEFLLSDEFESKELEINTEYAVSINNGRASWNQSSDKSLFTDLNFNVKLGYLSSIVGPVGCGKSSLLQIILRELPLTEGQLCVNGVLSYASQEPWIFSASIRQNILFGNEMETDRYNAVIKCCALEADLKLFSHGDSTNAGEKGDSLSGGQKARVNLARAIYRKADIYLLDDPLSAVDAHVGKEIFENCIRTFLKDKTVILVTHQLQYLKHVDDVIIIEDGSVQARGAKLDFEESGLNFIKYIQETKKEEMEFSKKALIVQETDNSLMQKHEKQEEELEHRATGSIKFSTYKDYICASKSYLLLFVVSLLFVLTQLATSGSSYFVAYWVNTQEEPHHWEQATYMYTFSGIIGASIIFGVFLLLTYVRLCLGNSTSLHNEMFNTVIHANLMFFNQNSSGRIINRFAKDLGNIDELLPHSLFITLRAVLTIIGIFVVIIIIDVKFVIPTIVVLTLFYYARKLYLSTSLNVLRVESVARSYILSHITASMQGLTTIRVFGVQDLLKNEFNNFHDTHSTSLDVFSDTSKALSYWIDGICTLYIATVTLYFILSNERNGGTIGLAITQSLQVTNILSWCIRQLTEVENFMISVERILEYNSIDSELTLKDCNLQKPSHPWPNFGEIKFENVHLRYFANDFYVLKNFNFTIHPNEKIGIVGRTGAGKSSLISTLFRLVKAEGSIKIDGINIENVGLEDLRKKLSIIPQDPVLFSGPIRKNVDPFDEFEDEVIWKAFEEVRLKEIIENMDLGLSANISQGGSNLSVGQRQLICLARAIMRNNKILILDEATANIDLETDDIIQKTIRKKFSNCTVLTVAHRLNTIMDSDKVLVLETGEIVEYDHPHNLLQNKNGLFYSMLQQLDGSVINSLTEIAKKVKKSYNFIIGSYTLPLLMFGRRNIITEDDIYETHSEHNASTVGAEAKKLWKQEVENGTYRKKKPLLRNVIIKMNSGRYVATGAVLGCMELIFKPLQSVFLGYLISCYSSNSKDSPYVYAIGIIFMNLLTVVIMQPSLMESYQIGLNMRIICSTLIYDKVLYLKKSALEEATTGQIINLISNDIGVFEKCMFVSHYLWIGPIQTVIVLGLMYKEVGISSIFGVLLLSLFIPLFLYLRKLVSKVRTKMLIRRDERLRLMNEIIQGIKVIKMYAWEKPFKSVITKCRKLEVDSFRVLFCIKGVYLLYHLFTTIALYVTITSSTLINNSISPKSVFVVFSFFSTLSTTLTFFVPTALTNLSDTNVSLERINTFLISEECELKELEINKTYAVSISEGCSNWTRSLDKNLFTNLNLNVKLGSLSSIIGPVGCGKSSLLQIILRELPLTEGQLSVNGVLSYASQEPWIFSASIRQNILFGSEMDTDRYNAVIECCALGCDLKLFPSGDNTIAGENGDLLSGGQKARVNLARAIYRRADIYLLDDPFSAVDAHVGKEIFENCIRTFLKDKTVILVTHQLQYLKYMDEIIVIEDGYIQAQGTKSELEASGLNFIQYARDVENEKVDDSEKTQTVQENDTSPIEKQEKQLEPLATGSIQFSTYKDYICASKSYFLIFIVPLLFILTQLSTTGSSYFIAYWVNIQEKPGYLGQTTYIYIYSGIIGSSIIFGIFLLLAYVSLSLKNSTSLHNNMFNKVIQANLNFFNRNSSGRIINRFSKDLGSADEFLPYSLFTAIRSGLSILGVYGVVILVDVKFVIPAVVIVASFYYARKLYLLTSLNILRVEGAARSYIFGHVTASIQGLTTIRAFNMQDVLKNEFNNFHDAHITSLDMFNTTTRALSYTMDNVCLLYIATVSLYFTLSNEKYGGNIGLVMTQSLQIISVLSWSIRQLTEVDNFMISIERVLEYNSIESEFTLTSSNLEKPSNLWPNRGEIKFENVYLKYSITKPYVLNNLNFTIRSNEKIGIVGRTGAGKSSLISILFRLVKIEGCITIDGINIQNIGLEDLRKNLSIIPQDPFLFSNSIRKNIDPFDEFEDDIIWKALEEVKLKNIVENMDLGLSSNISQGGSNLSIGQRQLICLARAVIRNNKILILDEATANVDLQTDDIIQKTIRKVFSNCTVLTIAHRLNTIMDSDKILVLEAGKVVEYDHPHNLLQKQNGIFYSTLQQLDSSIINSLTDIAKKNYKLSINKEDE
ncbi:hypothetical protein FQA39_LY15340 [Lamprigera yunnana]|nr:hypothetical protein FQA39_LY15340 [Lamprigera yunnana]